MEDIFRMTEQERQEATERNDRQAEREKNRRWWIQVFVSCSSLVAAITAILIVLLRQ